MSSRRFFLELIQSLFHSDLAEFDKASVQSIGPNKQLLL
jgi:hypothetical protein